MKRMVFLIAWLFSFGGLSPVFSQVWPNDEAGDRVNEREAYMNGNGINIKFQNTTELSGWSAIMNTHTWSGAAAFNLTDGIAFMVGARVYIAGKTTPVTDAGQIKSRSDLDTLYYCQTSYREEMDRDPTGAIEWGFYPCSGYCNYAHEAPAMSNKPETWPWGWPSKGNEKKWYGQWFGRRGAGITNADLECYFVVNDAQDQENLMPNSSIKYYPRPGHTIGEIDPNISMQKGLPWGGLGIRVAVRGYQWNNPLADDMIFWEYSITNISDFALPELAVGFWIDAVADYDARGSDSLDIVYCWDSDGVNSQGISPAASLGFIFAETAGKPDDSIDNDLDGIIDEKRDNQALVKIGATDGIHNIENFLSYYHMKYSDLRAHWDADEDQDWDDGIDANGNGRYDSGEFAGDDVGLDGLGPEDPKYWAPDAGECNHKPDYVAGQGCEPDFAAADVNESDMMGLSSFDVLLAPSHSQPFAHWFRNDKSMWELLGNGRIKEYSGSISANWVITMATGPLRLEKAKTQNVTFAIAHSHDPYYGFAQRPISAPSLYQQKITAQYIANADYTLNFLKALAPAKPELQATCRNDSVIIRWDNGAELNTIEPLLQNRNDFEGYKLLRKSKLSKSSDLWSEPELIFQCDLVDGITGNFPQGNDYYLGNDSGLAHEYVDHEVFEGGIYNYLLVAYDYGLPSDSLHFRGMADYYIPPLESSAMVSEVKVPFPDKIDFPVQTAPSHMTGTGYIVPEVVSKKDVKSQHTYLVTFRADTVQWLRDFQPDVYGLADGIRIFDITNHDSQLVYTDFGDRPGSIINPPDAEHEYPYIPASIELLTAAFDGLRLRIFADAVVAQPDLAQTGWVTGSSPMRYIVTNDGANYFPWDHEIVFTGHDSAFVGKVAFKTMKDESGMRIDRTKIILHQSFSFYIRNTTLGDSVAGQPVRLDMVAQDMDNDAQFNMLKDRILVGYLTSRGYWAGTAFILDFQNAASEAELPKAGDVFQLKFKRPFGAQDTLRFIVDPDATIVKGSRLVPSRMELLPNYPNPFNLETTIAYSIAEPGRVVVDILNVRGQCITRILDKYQAAGSYRVAFHAINLPSGLYFCSLKAGAFQQVNKMTLIK